MTLKNTEFVKEATLKLLVVIERKTFFCCPHLIKIKIKLGVYGVFRNMLQNPKLDKIRKIHRMMNRTTQLNLTN